MINYILRHFNTIHRRRRCSHTPRKDNLHYIFPNQIKQQLPQAPILGIFGELSEDVAKLVERRSQQSSNRLIGLSKEKGTVRTSTSQTPGYLQACPEHSGGTW